MRLLNTTTLQIESNEFEYFKAQGYAILSHRWVGQEITFEEIKEIGLKLRAAEEKQASSPQLDKIHGACVTARELGFAWIWIDNCCINKSSATEESESINSMFKWYRDARVCITYLSDVRQTSLREPQHHNTMKIATGDHGMPTILATKTDVPPVFQSTRGQTPSEWFSRGWTLQELLAPPEMRFYDCNWTYLGNKSSLAHDIESVTGIEVDYLTGVKHFRKACIATKMSWMAGRTTSRIEDIAYSMLGLFDIMMNPRYGEGQRAFMRLQHELLSSTTDESLYAWKMPSPATREAYDIESSAETIWHGDEWGILAPTPDWFKNCGSFSTEGGREISRLPEAFRVVQQGVKIPYFEAGMQVKYAVIMLLATFTFLGAIPIWYFTLRRFKKRLMEGIVFPLNCWTRDESGRYAAVSLYLRPIGKFGLQQEQLIMKRFRCYELPLSYKYHRQDDNKVQLVVAQPQHRYEN
jgi:hypothetical protein